MRRIGLTGGIGSGKTYVAEIFKELGIPVFSADVSAKMAYSEPNIRDQVIALLGSGSYTNNQLNKSFIASRIFEDEYLLERLNQVIHPWVEDKFEKWAANLSEPAYLIKEAAILFETGKNKNLDQIICVHAPEEVRINRVISRDQSTRKEVMNRIAKQWPQAKKIKHSDFLIDNDGTKLVLPQIIEIHSRLIKM